MQRTQIQSGPMNRVRGLRSMLVAGLSLCIAAAHAQDVIRSPGGESDDAGKPRRGATLNHPPVLNVIRYQTQEDTPVTIKLTATDPDPGDVVRFQVSELPALGTLYQIAADGQVQVDRPMARGEFITNAHGLVRYVPRLNFNGTDLLRVLPYDRVGPGPWAPGLPIDVLGVNDAPIAHDVVVNWPNTGGTSIFNIALDPYDPDQPISEIQTCITSLPAEGTLMDRDSGQVITQTPFFTHSFYFKYTYPHPEAIGWGCSEPTPDLPDTFPFEAARFTFRFFDGTAYSEEKSARLNYEYANTAAFLTSPLEYDTAEDTPVNFTLSGADIDGDNFRFRISALPLHGSLYRNGQPFDGSSLLTNNAALTYVPNPNFNTLDATPDTVHVQVIDAAAGARDCDYAIEFHVSAVNDAPVIYGAPSGLGTEPGAYVGFSSLAAADDAAAGSLLTMDLEATGPAGEAVGMPHPSAALASFQQVSAKHVHMEGTLSAINASCAGGIRYFVADNGETVANLVVTVHDEGNSGAGTPLTATLVIPIEVYGECTDCGG